MSTRRLKPVYGEKLVLPSRLAENLFWLGRYSARCEDKARLLRTTLGVRTNGSLWPQALAGRLQALAGAAGILSDRLSLKHFSLIDIEMRTVAA